MIKRTRSEAAAVRRLVERTAPDYLACRALRRHQYNAPAVELDRRPGTRELALASPCACGLVRTDRWSVRVHPDGATLDVREHVGRTYAYPPGYLLPHGAPRPELEDWLEAWLAVQLRGTGLRLAG